MSDVEQAKAHFFAALDLLDARKFPAAETELRAALAIVPDRPSAVANLAVALFEQDKLEEAIGTARRATALDPDDHAGWLVLGSSLGKQGALDEALSAMDRAVAAGPGNPRTLMGRASVNTEKKRYDLAIADYRSAMGLGTDEPDLLGLLLAAQMSACDWTDLDTLTATFLDGIRNGTMRGEPFSFLWLPSTAADQFLCGRATTERDYPAMPPLHRGERRGGGRIRVAYVSGDFRRHPLAYLFVGVPEHHDRSRFETFGVSYGPDDGSDIRARVAAGFDHFVDMHGAGDLAIARYIHDNAIDVAVDLSGFTSGGRPRVLALRPAPVAVSYFGYPGTSGAPYMDYIIADPVIVPPAHERFYSEAVVRLPDTYQANDDRRPVAAETPSRAAAGLPDAGFVFCSFNNTYKITPPVFDIWMRILDAVPGSVLWLLASNATAPDNLRREAAARGVAPERLVFAPGVPIEQHLARHRLADLSLDTFPYNAHTTAADALWAGLPMITCPGETFASRVAAGVLPAIGLPELVTSSFAEYEALALALARDPARLAAIKAKLAANRTTTPLFDPARFTRHLESAYATMVERHQRGEKPSALTVARLP